MDSVVHFEIPADDLARAKKFYSTVFGWTINEIPQMGYVLVGTTEANEQEMPKEPGAINGGMMKRQNPVNAPVITINVDSIDGSLGKIKANGGQTLREKMQVGEMGYAAYFKDSEGNVIGLWQSAH